MAANSILIDITRCTGCRSCQVACKEWNHRDRDPAADSSSGYQGIPGLSSDSWTVVRFLERAGDGGGLPGGKWEFFKQQCMHCSQAPCADACPTSAIGHTSEGYVFVLVDRCTGCGGCVQACPYHAIHLDQAQGIASKCTFCFDRVVAGLAPACAKACPTGTIQYGERDILLEDARVRVDALRAGDYPEASLYGDRQLGGLQQMYVLPYPPSSYGLPATPLRPMDRWVGSWMGGMVAAAALVALPFWWVIRRRNRLDSEMKGN